VETNVPRYSSIDVLKATGIIAVVWIHAFQQLGTTNPPIIMRVGFLTRFAVPAFFFASGFLYTHGRPLTAREFAARRLVRILVPYLVASLLAIGFRRWVLFEPVSARQALFDLATGGAWGIYYFIPLLLGAAVVAQGVFRFRPLAWPLFVIFWVLGLLSEAWMIPFGGLYWQFRSPLRWWGYFFAGWVVAPFTPALQQLPPARRRLMGVAALIVAATASVYAIFALPPSFSRELAALQYVTIYGIVVGLFLLTLNVGDVPFIRWLSEATYPIYLYHFFAVTLVHHWVAPPLRNPAAFVLGGVVSIAVVSTGRSVLGRRARLLIG
jgi:peptidoglycan/LPS O-acetylase OafA/YrhL